MQVGGGSWSIPKLSEVDLYTSSVIIELEKKKNTKKVNNASSCTNSVPYSSLFVCLYHLMYYWGFLVV